ncbi:MAG: SGNH/GDSL hydrolase family protein [Acidobacteriota bacterium]
MTAHDSFSSEGGPFRGVPPRGGPSRVAPKLRAWGAKLLLLTVSTCVALLLCEGLLRTFVRVGSFRYVADDGRSWNVPDPQRDYVLTPGYRGRLEAPEFEHRVEVNDQGFRGDEPRLGGRGPIFVVGDSFVFGVGAAAEETLPARLGSHLTGTPLAGEVWNLGIPSHASPQYVRTVAAYRSVAEPTWVVACFFLGSLPGGANDLWGAVEFEEARAAEESPPSGGGAAGTPSEAREPSWRDRLRPGRVKKWLARSSALYTFGMARVGPALRARRHRDRRLAPAEVERLERGWGLLRRDLGALATAAEEGGFRLLLVHIPEHSDVRNGQRAVADRFSALATELGLPAVDVHGLLAPSGGDGFYYPIDGHLDPRGYDRVARAVASAMLKAAAGGDPQGTAADQAVVEPDSKPSRNSSPLKKPS